MPLPLGMMNLTVTLSSLGGIRSVNGVGSASG